MTTMQERNEGQEKAVIPVSDPYEPNKKVSIREEIQRLWQRKDDESKTIAEGRTLRSDEDRERDSLNWAFERIPISLFPQVPHVIELESDMPLLDALHLLQSHRILSAPVRDSQSLTRAGVVGTGGKGSWMDEYLGMLEYSSVVLYILGLAEAAASGVTAGVATLGGTTGGIAAALGLLAMGATGGIAAAGALGGIAAGAALSGGAMAAGAGQSGTAFANYLGAGFFEAVKESKIIEHTKVSTLTGTFRWGPFLPVEPEDNLLTLLLLLSKYRMKTVPVVETGKEKVQNMISQSSVLNVLADCDGLEWFEVVASRSLEDLGLPLMKPSQVIKVEDSQPVLEPFRRMLVHRVGGLPVVAEGSNGRLVANVSARDIRFLLDHPEHFKEKKELLVRDFIEAMKIPPGPEDEFPIMSPPVTCTVSDTLRDVIQRLRNARIHRVYVVDQSENLTGVVTLRDIIGKFVYEPMNYFGDFFGDVALPSLPEAPDYPEGIAVL
eukprot:TRINITY_DN1096_c0_g6_i1.p1 TRINITY_DN1096_c0_g6~~TRINITY_DN1096_c0_g6_i1.p1  ORF type:complete len:494 (-),score=110.86 TRINITY_DN1096_c0_g6_i1:1269-2750(-)